jgi:spore coat polysaccharide biosynthesis predicted glycosyltransferase SpsG
MRLVVRCDGGSATGLGHAGRALALAEEIGRRLEVRPAFVSRPDPLLLRFLEGRGIDLIALDAQGYAPDAVLAAAAPEAIIVSDTYELDQSAMDAIGASGRRHVVVDDFARLSRWPCELVVNPNLGADAAAYGGAAAAAGSQYALLRHEVRIRGVEERRVRERADRVLVCLGGGTWPDEAYEILGRLGRLAGQGVEIRAAVDADVPAGVHAVSQRSLPDQLAWADVGVLSGGVVKYEAACTSLPMLLLAAVEHQRGVAEAFAAAGAAEYLGPFDAVDAAGVAVRVEALLGRAEQRRELARRAHELVDGQGVERVTDLLLGSTTA